MLHVGRWRTSSEERGCNCLFNGWGVVSTRGMGARFSSTHFPQGSQFGSTDVGMADRHHCHHVGGETTGTTISYNQGLSNGCRVKKAYQCFCNSWHDVALPQLHSGQTIRLMWKWVGSLLDDSLLVLKEWLKKLTLRDSSKWFAFLLFSFLV